MTDDLNLDSWRVGTLGGPGTSLMTTWRRQCHDSTCTPVAIGCDCKVPWTEPYNAKLQTHRSLCGARHLRQTSPSLVTAHRNTRSSLTRPTLSISSCAISRLSLGRASFILAQRMSHNRSGVRRADRTVVSRLSACRSGATRHSGFAADLCVRWRVAPHQPPACQLPLSVLGSYNTYYLVPPNLRSSGRCRSGEWGEIQIANCAATSICSTCVGMSVVAL